MGVLRSTQSLQAEVEEMRHMLRGTSRDAFKMQPASVKRSTGGDQLEGDQRLVCVTGGISFLGFAVVNRLLELGYTVRLALETQGHYPLFFLSFFFPFADFHPNNLEIIPKTWNRIFSEW